jgi:hypothetical protein
VIAYRATLDVPREQADLCSGGFIAVCRAVECLVTHQAPVETRERRLCLHRHGCSFAQWTIQDASSPLPSGHLATVQTDEAVNGNDTSKCDFAAVAYAAP